MQRNTRVHVIMGLMASSVYLLQGYGHTVLNSLLSVSSFTQTFPAIKLPSDHTKLLGATELQGLVVGILDIGCAVGSFTCCFGERFGRKMFMLGALLIAVVGIVLQFTAYHLPQLIVARLVTGIGVGQASTTIPLWLSECLEPNQRGKATLLYGAFANVGMVLSMLVDLAFYFVHDTSLSWRIPIGVEILPCILAIVLGTSVPESPRWLLNNNRYTEAESALASLRGRSRDDTQIHNEIRQISKMSRHPTKSSFSWRDGMYRGYMAVSLSILCTMSGANVISFFSTDILQNQLNFSPVLSRILSTAMQCGQMIFSFVAIIFIERSGRRPIMLVSSLIMCVGMSSILGVSSVKQSFGTNMAVIILQFLCLCGNPIGFHITPHLYAAEISPPKIRNYVMSSATFVHWIFVFLIAQITPIAFEKIQYRYYAVYAATNAFDFICLYLLFPETKGKSLEEIDEIFRQAGSPLNVVACAADYHPKRFKHVSFFEGAEEFTMYSSSDGDIPGYGKSESKV